MVAWMRPGYSDLPPASSVPQTGQSGASSNPQTWLAGISLVNGDFNRNYFALSDLHGDKLFCHSFWHHLKIYLSYIFFFWASVCSDIWLWHSIWHSILTFYLAPILPSLLASILTFSLAFYLAAAFFLIFYLASILTFFLAPILAFYLALCDILFWQSIW